MYMCFYLRVFFPLKVYGLQFSAFDLDQPFPFPSVRMHSCTWQYQYTLNGRRPIRNLTSPKQGSQPKGTQRADSNRGPLSLVITFYTCLQPHSMSDDNRATESGCFSFPVTSLFRSTLDERDHCSAAHLKSLCKYEK